MLERLKEVLTAEGSHFYRIDHRWQPKNLIPDPYRRNLLKDAQARYSRITKAEDEFQRLIRAPLYIGILKRMRLTIKDAQFAWRTDDLKFIRAISSFFKDYGTVIHNLKIDEARGRLDQPE